MSNQRQQIAEETQALLQRLLDADHAGVEITQVQLQRVEPPLAVIDAFNDVQRARADQERAPQRGAGLRQRHPAARPRRGGAHQAGRRGLQGFSRQSRRRRGEAFLDLLSPELSSPRTSPPGGSIMESVDEMLRSRRG